MGRRMVIAASVAAVGALSGCTYRAASVHLPEPMRAVAPDVANVQVAVAGGGSTDDPNERDVAATTADIVSRSIAKEASGGAPAVVHVDVDLGEYRYFFRGVKDGMGIATIMLAALGGLKLDRRSLAVTVRFESNGKTFVGRGSATKDGSIYASAERRALAVALDQALADAVATR